MSKSTLRRTLGIGLVAATMAVAEPLWAKSPHSSCAAYGTIVVGHDGTNFTAETFGNSPYPAEAKTVLVDLESLEPGKSTLCYDVLLLASAKSQGVEIRVKFDNFNVPNVFGPGGETDPKKRRKKAMTFDAAPASWDEIEYPAGSGGYISGKRIQFEVRIKAGSDPWITVDPDIVIQKPGT